MYLLIENSKLLSNAPIIVKPKGVGEVGYGVEILIFFEKNVKFSIPGATYLVKSIKIPHPQASKGQLHTSNNSFKFPILATSCTIKIPTWGTVLTIKFLWVIPPPPRLNIVKCIMLNKNLELIM